MNLSLSVRALRVVAEPRRQQILQLIWHEERCAGAIAAAVDVTFSAVSQHLARMRDIGVVSVRRAGKQRFYSVDKATLGPLAAFLEAQWTERLSALKQLAEEEERRTR
ncbi:MAG: ArsR/SmtB family transcription factor [Planctomycetota bacterium]